MSRNMTSQHARYRIQNKDRSSIINAANPDCWAAWSPDMHINMQFWDSEHDAAPEEAVQARLPSQNRPGLFLHTQGRVGNIFACDLLVVSRK